MYELLGYRSIHAIHSYSSLYEEVEKYINLWLSTYHSGKVKISRYSIFERKYRLLFDIGKISRYRYQYIARTNVYTRIHAYSHWKYTCPYVLLLSDTWIAHLCISKPSPVPPPSLDCQMYDDVGQSSSPLASRPTRPLCATGSSNWHFQNQKSYEKTNN